VTIGPAGQVTGSLAGGQPFATTIPVALGGNGLAGDLAAHHVQVTATAAMSSSLLSVLIGLLPLLLIGGLLYFGVRNARRPGLGGLGRAAGLTKARARVIDAERPATRFADVAGYPAVKTEISEVVDYLRNPGRYHAAGARGPRGVLMAGPPGTGKTLLARAVAGEAHVPFLSVSGSSFVEMFVGVGAARVRDLFDQARAQAPAILFIDEIDALGARREPGGLPGSDEREQTLNQLLAEMDGFEDSGGVVVLAATNRPDALDLALRRPGRFDREVHVPLPNRAERRAILASHARGKNLDPGTDFDQAAAATPGFSGADLANLVNEAALTAVRDGRTTLTAADFADARDRVLLGTRHTTPCPPASSPPSPSTRPGTPSSPRCPATPTRSAASPSSAPGTPSVSPRCSPTTTGASTASTTSPTRSPSVSAAARPNALPAARHLPAPLTTSPPPPLSPPRWSASTASAPSARSATPLSPRAIPASAATPSTPNGSSTRKSPPSSPAPRPAPWSYSPATSTP
jgi:AAA+ superfamily predicted ATPase